MRRFAALPVCFALVQALFLAPFRHVHADHDHAAVVHTHFYSASFHFHEVAHHEPSNGPQWDDIDEHSSAQSLDTFTLAFAPSIAPFVLPRGPVFEPVPLTHYEPIAPVDACANDPPALDNSNPRAPPA